MNFQTGQTVANAAIVPLSTTGQITVNVSHGTHVIMDVNGYFSDTYTGNPLQLNGFQLVASLPHPLMLATNNSPSCSSGCGITADVYSNQTASAIFGTYQGTGNGRGVYGTVAQGGTTSVGVRGEYYGPGGNGYGVWGHHFGFGIGVYGSTVDRVGPSSGTRTARGSASVERRPAAAPVFKASLVRMVWVSRGRAGAGGTGVYFSGGLAGTGTKSFIEPHPTDPALAIKYVSLEGPEAGTYFRGKGKFQRGLATIAMPETFRMVTAEQGLSVQITPIGAMASFAVMRIGLDGIVVQASRDVEFFYTVNGVRRAYKDWDPITSSELAFRPRGPGRSRSRATSSEDERKRLIANGTYTEDGKVNPETARRLGWDKAWRKKSVRRKTLVLGTLALFGCVVGSAQEIPLTDWTAPKYSLGGLGKAVDATAPRAFIGLQPCRILDTRGNGAPIAGGIFANSEARNYTITGICGLPNGTDAVSVNFTVTGSPAAPPARSCCVAAGRTDSTGLSSELPGGSDGREREPSFLNTGGRSRSTSATART